MKKSLTLLFIISTVFLSAQLNWNNTFFSAQLSNNERIIRTQALYGEVSLLYQSNDGIISNAMYPLNDNFSNYQIQLSEPACPYIGFKCISDSLKEVLPVFYNANNTPLQSHLSHLTFDPIGDANFTNTNLDLVELRATFSSDKLYFSLTNNGGGFPVSSGFNYFAYMVAIVNPDADSTATTNVFGLMYTVDISGIISPGLYKITGTGINDMIQIGNIAASVITGSNTILLSCNISDLLADSDFSSWFNEINPKIGVMALTNRISLVTGNQLADQTDGCTLILQQIQINQEQASLPYLSNVQYEVLSDTHIIFTTDFYSNESYLPVISKILFSNGYESLMHPIQFPDFNSTVGYFANIDTEDIMNWEYATMIFSVDGVNFTESSVYPTTVYEQEMISSTIPLFKVFPNPSKGVFTLSVTDDIKNYSYEIFDVKGRKIFNSGTLLGKQPYKVEFVNIDGFYLPSDIYVVRCISQGKIFARKILIVN